MPTAVMIVHDTETGTSGGYMAELLGCPEETILRAWKELDEENRNARAEASGIYSDSLLQFNSDPRIAHIVLNHGTYVAIVEYMTSYGDDVFPTAASVHLHTIHSRQEQAGEHLEDIG